MKRASLKFFKNRVALLSLDGRSFFSKRGRFLRRSMLIRELILKK